MPICVKLSNNGLLTNFIQVLDWLAYGMLVDTPVGVDWTIPENRETWDFHYGNGQPNVWHAYFTPLTCPTQHLLKVGEVRDTFLRGFRSFALYQALERGHAGQRLAPLTMALQRYVHLLPHLSDQIESTAQQFGGFTLIGVHLRNPMGARGIYGAVPKLNRYRRSIEGIINALPPATPWRIFAASDRDGMIEELAALFPGRVLSQQGVLRAPRDSRQEIHAQPNEQHDLGAEVLTDCWLLSRCTHLVGAQSAICLTANILNPTLCFHCVRPPGYRWLGWVEYGIKSAWCWLFESRHPGVTEILKRYGHTPKSRTIISISDSNRPK